MSATQNTIINTIEIINTVIIIAFLGIFLWRFFTLGHMGNYNEHINHYPKDRIIFAFVYILISFAFLLTYIIGKDSDAKTIILNGGVGQCLNSLILLLHMSVLKRQLQKKQPYTKFHMIYMIYLPIISLARLTFAVIKLQDGQKNDTSDGVITAFSIILFLITLILLFLWIRKRKELPQNQDYRLLNKQSFAFTNPLQNRSHDYSRSKDFSRKIFPTVMVQKGRIRIILEMMVQNDILKSAFQSQYLKPPSIRPQSQDISKSQHLQIISSHLYTIEQIKQIYIECNRFDIKSKIHFKNFKMGEFYQELKAFLDELFGIKKSYVEEILELFNVEKTQMLTITKNIQKQCVSFFQMDVCEHVDANAMFVSIVIFKNFWIDDHFIFYMNVKSADFKDKATFYRRYKDFEEFHETLKQILNQNGMDSFILPSLPKKHLFSWDYNQKIKMRQKYLQCYCRQIANDQILMENVPPARQHILNFLGLKKTISVETQKKKFQRFYIGLKIMKGNITQALINEEYVTYYQFRIFKNGEFLHTISRRFQQFVHLHEAITRWMDNISITYKFLVLPDKILFKSEEDRQEKLLKYLQSLIQIKQIYKLYNVTRFLNLGSDGDSDLNKVGFSIIRKQSGNQDMQAKSRNSGISMRHTSMSDLIQDLVVE